MQLAPSRDLRGLTPVQLQILGLLADDWTTTRIAATLGVTPRAVASQLRRGWAQLGAPARDVATLQALHEGMYVPASFLSAQDRVPRTGSARQAARGGEPPMTARRMGHSVAVGRTLDGR